MIEKTILVWFRNDLRIHDNEMLNEAIARADNVLPVYCFDPRYFGKTSLGTQKTGYLRARFLLESVAGLKKSLQRLGGDLLIQVGKPEDVLPALCKKFGVSEVYHHREVAVEETAVSGLVEASLWKSRINLKHFIGHTLFHKEDLPFPIKNIPNNYVLFRRKIERESIVRRPYASPGSVRVPPDVQWGDLPLPEDLGVERTKGMEEAHVTGGEEEGLDALMRLISAAGEVKKIEGGDSPLAEIVLSPWLSLGCLSPRTVYWTVKDQLPAKSELGLRMVDKLRWRDYNRFMLKKHGALQEKQEPVLTSAELKRFKRWEQGNTGDLLVDACIRELNESGYISDRCVLFLSSHLMQEMKVQWPAGYAYFEEKAINFSAALIWGNWALEKGVFSCGKQENQKFEDIMHDPRIKRRLEMLQAG